MRIAFFGIIGRYPWGGVGWCSLMHLLGLRRLGHEVAYFEDTCECPYDPEADAISVDPSCAVRCVAESLEPFGFAGRWCYIDHAGGHHGMDESAARAWCASADLMVVLSGGCWIWRDHYLAIPQRAFIDSDPAFTQLAIDKARREDPGGWYQRFFESYTRLFTFGGNIGQPDCSVPATPFEWIPTWQPICTDLWRPPAPPMPSRRCWTTVMTWRIESFQDIGGNKDAEFAKVATLSEKLAAAGIQIELAVNGPRAALRQHGWRAVDAMAATSNLWNYHAYIASSRAEFSVAKRTYAATQCGWFSDRTICYLASGKPAVVQDTGFPRLLPTGEGLLAWRDRDDALAGILEVESDYPRHAAAARAIAEEHFRAEKVLARMLDAIG